MKRLLLLSSAFALLMSATAQNRNSNVVMHPLNQPHQYMKVDKSQLRIENYVPYQVPGIPSVVMPSFAHPANVQVSSTVTEATLGTTLYDLQSNRGPAKRIVNNGNGTLSAVWTHIPVGSTTATPRGTAYGYYNGTSWTTTNGNIQSVRTGFTNIATTSAGEWVCAHTGATGLLLTHRPTIGSGTWTEDTVGDYAQFTNQADVWSRMGVGGANNTTVHVIVNSQGTGTTPVLNQNGPLTYSRSLDGGDTWDMDHVLLPGSDDANYLGFSAEDYHLAVRGDVVAVVAGGFEQDVVLWKSTDNGSTWTKTVVFPFPIALFDDATMISDIDADGVADSIETSADDPTISIDNNGMCHIAFGRQLVFADGTNVLLDRLRDGLYYWHEGMATAQIVAAAEDFNGNGIIDLTANPLTSDLGLYGLAGMLTHPSIGFDDNNDVYLCYTAPNELCDTNSFHCTLRNVYIKRSNDMGATWGTPVNVIATDPEFSEGSWPSLAMKVDGSGSTSVAHIEYQRDPAPYYSSLFIAVSTNAAFAEQQGWNQTNGIPNPNDIIYARVTGITTGVQQHDAVNLQVSVAPNPASSIVNINFSLTQKEQVNFEMIDVLGNTVMSQNFGDIAAGNFVRTIDVSKLASGVYLYNLKTSASQATGKIVIK